MKKIETYGHVTDDGILKISYRAKFDQAVKMLSGDRVKVTVEKLYKRRTTVKIHETGEVTKAQNGYYFGVVVSEYRNGAWETQGRPLSTQEAHEELKANCNYIENYNEDTGQIMRKIESTATLTTVQFEEYLTRCREFIREWFGIDVALPEDIGYK